MKANNFAQARTLASWLNSLESNWNDVRIEADIERVNEINKGQEVSMQVRAYLGRLQPEDVRVELYAGTMFRDNIINPQIMELTYCGFRDGSHHYEGRVTPNKTGTFAFAIRALPGHPSLERGVTTNFVRWAN